MYQPKTIEGFANSVANNFNWTNTFGLGRTILAVGSIITLLLNDPEMLVAPLGEMVTRDATIFVAKLSIFHLLSEHLFLAKFIGLLILVITASGWRPRITGVFHWWIAYSIAASCMVVDGGDQIAGVLTLVLLPMCLADGRKWHWQFVEGKSSSFLQKHLNIVGAGSYFLVRLQIAYIYFHAGVGKMAVDEWMNGTAIYYWSQSPLFAMPDWLTPILGPLFENSLIITASTWGIMIFELVLFLGLVINEKWRPTLLKLGLLFHFTIILLYGLVSFFFTMAGCLVLYLGPKAGFDFIPELWNKFTTWKTNLFTTKEPSGTLIPELAKINSSPNTSN